jgi:hypothetical protein
MHMHAGARTAGRLNRPPRFRRQRRSHGDDDDAECGGGAPLIISRSMQCSAIEGEEFRESTAEYVLSCQSRWPFELLIRCSMQSLKTDPYTWCNT